MTGATEPCTKCNRGAFDLSDGVVKCAACGRPADVDAIVRESIALAIEQRAEKLDLTDRNTAIHMQALASDIRAGLYGEQAVAA